MYSISPLLKGLNKPCHVNIAHRLPLQRDQFHLVFFHLVVVNSKLDFALPVCLASREVKWWALSSSRHLLSYTVFSEGAAATAAAARIAMGFALKLPCTIKSHNSTYLSFKRETKVKCRA